jgi:hypothetical protein
MQKEIKYDFDILRNRIHVNFILLLGKIFNKMQMIICVNKKEK